MKNLLLLSLAALLSGCASFQTASNNNVSIPEKIKITADSKPIEKVASIVGQTFKVTNDALVKEKDGSQARKIDLKTEGLAQLIKGFVLVGGIIMVVGLAVIWLLRKFVEGLLALGLGFSIIIGTLLIKAVAGFLVWLSVVLAIVGMVWLAYTVYRHRKNITSLAKDLVDNGKIDGSSNISKDIQAS